MAAMEPLSGEALQSRPELASGGYILGGNLKRRTCSRLSKQGVLPSSITWQDLYDCFHLPATQASVKLGVSLSVLKRACRRLGVGRWPFRKISSLKRKLGADGAAGGLNDCVLDDREITDKALSKMAWASNSGCSDSHQHRGSVKDEDGDAWTSEDSSDERCGDGLRALGQSDNGSLVDADRPARVWADERDGLSYNSMASSTTALRDSWGRIHFGRSLDMSLAEQSSLLLSAAGSSLGKPSPSLTSFSAAFPPLGRGSSAAFRSLVPSP
ncbi:hypothetical protein H632_c620p1, partial [Helicosporidium sp. ATCC 50920]